MPSNDFADILPGLGLVHVSVESRLPHGRPRELAEEAQSLRRQDVAEEVSIDLLDHSHRAWGEPRPAPGGTEAPSPGVRSVDLPFEEALRFQALADSSTFVDVEHLKAAYALWRYAVESAQQIFGGMTGSTDADRVLRELQPFKDHRLSRSHIYSIFGRHATRTKALFDIDCAFTIPRSDLERLAHAYSVPLLRPISAVPDDSRFGVRSNFAEGSQEVERITDFLGGCTS